MSQNGSKFYLHFTKELEVGELVMKGGEHDPLQDMPRTQTAPVNQLHDVIFQPDTKVDPFFDFRVDDTDDCRIISGLSYGKRNEIYSIFLLPKRLWVY